MQTTRSSRAFLLAAVVLGVLATVAAFVYLNSISGQDRGPTVKVLVAKRDLRPNQVLEPEKDLEEMEMPARFTELKARSLSIEAKASYKGSRVNRRILAGTPVMTADLAANQDIELSSPDSRAMAISVRGANGLTGLLKPGHYVRLMVTRPVARQRMPVSLSTRPSAPPGEEGGDSLFASETTMKFETVPISDQAFRVLAVGASVSPQLTAAEAYESLAHAESQQMVTLEVTDAQAKTILETSGAGQLPVTLLRCPAPGK